MISGRKKKQLDAHCRTYVVGRGKRTGHEHLAGYRATDGKHMGYSTSGRPDAVRFPTKMVEYATNKHARLVVHHNHPRGTSLSREDLHNLGRLPGTLEVHAHGHSKQWYLASSSRDRYFSDLILVADEAFDRCLWDIGGSSVPEELHNHLFNLGFAQAGAIRYEHELDSALKHKYDDVSSESIDLLIQAVVGAVKAERSRRKCCF